MYENQIEYSLTFKGRKFVRKKKKMGNLGVLNSHISGIKVANLQE